MKLLLLLFILSIFLNSCGNREPISGNFKNIYINNNAVLDTVDLSKQIDSIEVVPLKEIAPNLIGAAYQMYIVNDYYIIYDKVYSKKVNVYYKDGTFVKTLSQNGIKTNEGLNISDVWVNSKKEIFVYDFALMKIYEYDSSLVFKKTISCPTLLHYNHVAQIPNSTDFVGFANYNMYNRKLTKSYPSILDNLRGSDLTFESSYIGYNVKYEGALFLTLNDNFTLYKDSLYFRQTYDKYIYNITNEKISKAYKITYSSNNLPDNFLDLIDRNIKLFKDKDLSATLAKRNSFFSNYCYPGDDWIENDKFTYLTSVENNGKNTFILNSLIRKSDNKQYTAKFFKENNKFKIVLPPLRYFDSKENKFICFSSGYQLKKQLLLPNSPFLANNKITNESLCIIKIKMK